jgi:hypothetical protein
MLLPTAPWNNCPAHLCAVRMYQNQSFAVSNFLDFYLSQFLLRHLLLPIYLILVNFHWGSLTGELLFAV